MTHGKYLVFVQKMEVHLSEEQLKDEKFMQEYGQMISLCKNVEKLKLCCPDFEKHDKIFVKLLKNIHPNNVKRIECNRHLTFNMMIYLQTPLSLMYTQAAMFR